MRVAILLLTSVLAWASWSCDAETAPPSTTLRVHANFDAGWSLTQLELKSGDHASTYPSEPSALGSSEVVTIVLDDAAASEPLHLDVWGLVNGTRVAHGDANATPKLHQTVDVDVTLAHLPCGAWCTPGATSCAANGVRACEQRDDDACLEWSTPVLCPPEAGFCSLGQCSDHCVDECAAGEARCAGAEALERCGEADSDTCRDWLPAQPCPSEQVCEAGACVAPGVCHDECQSGQTKCAGNSTLQCGQFDADDCLDWGPPTPCAQGQSCSNGACATGCQDDCTENVCEGLTWRPCGQFDFDACKDLSAGTSCGPTDACAENTCDAQAGCSTTPTECSDPPESECVGTAVLRTYQATGVCTAGACHYAPTDVPCPNCPNCDPCATVQCNQVPAATCSGPMTLRTYTGPGTCSGGSCAYPYTDAPCNDGCSAGVCWATLSNEDQCNGDVGNISSDVPALVAARLTPSTYPFTVNKLFYGLGSLGVCNTGLVHTVYAFVGSGSTPDTGPVYSDTYQADMDTPNSDLGFQINLSNSISLQSGQSLFIAITLSGGDASTQQTCARICGQGLADRNLITLATIPYAWQTLESAVGVSATLRFSAGGTTP